MAKYDFKGIKQYGAKGMILALESTGVGKVMLDWGFRGIIEILFEWLVNWLANKGLIILNVIAISVEGHFDQQAFDREMEEALKKIQTSGGKLTPEQMKEIDAEVIRAFRKFALFSH